MVIPVPQYFKNGTEYLQLLQKLKFLFLKITPKSKPLYFIRSNKQLT